MTRDNGGTMKIFKDMKPFEGEPDLLAKAKEIEKRLDDFEPLSGRFLISSYLYEIPKNVSPDERRAYNTDIALYSYQRTLYETGEYADLRAANHHYEYYHIRRRSQETEDDMAYAALRKFAIAQSKEHPNVIYSTSKRTKSIASHMKKYCINVMRGYHESKGENIDEYVDSQVERIHDDKACRLIMDMPRVTPELVSPPELIDAIFDAANAMPRFMEFCRMRKMIANSLIDASTNISTRLNPEVAIYYKNYAENPKSGSNYRSFHICFESRRDKEEVEFQIRTFEWHFHAEYGTARHSDYKESQLVEVVNALHLDYLKYPEYRQAFLQFMDIINLDPTKIIIPNFFANGEYVLDKAGIIIPITTSEEVFCTKAKHRNIPDFDC